MNEKIKKIQWIKFIHVSLNGLMGVMFLLPLLFCQFNRMIEMREKGIKYYYKSCFTYSWQVIGFFFCIVEYKRLDSLY